jgi:YVTN family beta-propeller protein
MSYPASRFNQRSFRRIEMAALTVTVLGLLALAGCNGGGGKSAPTAPTKLTVRLTENSVGMIDSATNALVARVAVGRDPLDIVTTEGSVWVTNVGDKSVSEIDAATRKVVRTVKLTAPPTGLAAGEGGLWVTDGRNGTVERIDTGTGEVAQVIRLRPKLRTQFFTNTSSHLTGAAWMPVVAAGGSVWVGDAYSSRIFRIILSVGE